MNSEWRYLTQVIVLTVFTNGKTVELVYGTITIGNPELCSLIWLACAENWTSHCASAQGRTDDARYHANNYRGYINEIHADTFTREEQDAAWMALAEKHDLFEKQKTFIRRLRNEQTRKTKNDC